VFHPFFVIGNFQQVPTTDTREKKMLILAARIFNQVLLGHFKPPRLQKHLPKVIVYDVPFRCWPVDIDMFLHMNNASFVRVAELARWRIFVQTDILKLSKKNAIFLVVSQNVTYLKQLPPFQNYIIRTKVSVSENKWIHYSHTFQKPDSSSDSTKDPYIYATVECKAVLKERSGKTIRLNEISQDSDFYKHISETNNEEEVKL
jgi:acyl-CoA thioesterase FadM